MRQARLSGLIPKRRGRTTVCVPGVRVADDLSAASSARARPTCSGSRTSRISETWEGWLYLAAAQDAFSRRIVGWSMADHMRSDLVVDALNMAIARRRPEAGLIHHSDQDSQVRNESPASARLLVMELAGLEPATSWVRSRRSRASNSPGFPGLLRPPGVSFCDQLSHDYQGIPGYLVTGSAFCDQIRDRWRTMYVPEPRRPPGSANQRIATHVREGESDRLHARTRAGALNGSDHKGDGSRGAGSADHAAAPSRDCDSVDDSAAGRFALPSFGA
jgi:transposase InsO family protein